mmetsp:Transcript_37709/g.66282  ORF Transcript_37709/g.66282 Transcript_37709/m.66282 type:complete len:83 (-) Transcript_37709:633-881(-)
MTLDVGAVVPLVQTKVCCCETRYQESLRLHPCSSEQRMTFLLHSYEHRAVERKLDVHGSSAIVLMRKFLLSQLGYGNLFVAA